MPKFTYKNIKNILFLKIIKQKLKKKIFQFDFY